MAVEGKKVLVVEDTALNQKTLIRLLEKKGIVAEGADNGSICLEKIKTTQYDLIFMDYLMPDMDGVETFQKMQEMEHLCKNTPVIMLTAATDGGNKEEFLAKGFSDFLGKPVLPMNLYAVVEKFCS